LGVIRNNLSGQIKSFLLRPILLRLIFLTLIALIIVFFVSLPIKWTIIGGVALAAIIFWALLWMSGRDFEGLFLVVFAIGYVQGVIIKWAGDAIPQSLWGLFKYGLMFLMMGGFALRILMGKPVLINRGMRYWLLVWGLVWMMMVFLMLEAWNASPLYTPVGTIQMFGIGNMLLAVITYFCFHPRLIDTSLRLFVWTGLLAAVFGVLQRLMGPDRLAALGLLKGNFLFLGYDVPGFLVPV